MKKVKFKKSVIKYLKTHIGYETYDWILVDGKTPRGQAYNKNLMFLT